MTSIETPVKLSHCTGLKYISVLQVGCNPLSDQDEQHLNMLEKHVSSLFRFLSILFTNGKVQLIDRSFILIMFVCITKQ